MITEQQINSIVHRTAVGSDGAKLGKVGEVYLDGHSDVDGAPASNGRVDHVGEPGVVGHDTSGPTTDRAMTRSEERLKVGTESREAGRARLRKYVVTEQQQMSVP